MTKRQNIFLTIVAVLAWPSFILYGSYFSSAPLEEANSNGIHGRFLRVTHGQDVQRAHRERRRRVQLQGPRRRMQQITAPARTPTTFTVHLTLTETENAYDTSYSIFKTGVLERYGSGRVNYQIKENAECSSQCHDQAVGVGEVARSLLAQEPSQSSNPCLAVTTSSRKGECALPELQCNFPTCKAMVVVNEFCTSQSHGFNLRQYYPGLTPGGFLLLGPRIDAWKSLQQNQTEEETTLSAPSRKYAFNAIFSDVEDTSRKRLANVISTRREESLITALQVQPKEASSRPLPLPTYNLIYDRDDSDIPRKEQRLEASLEMQVIQDSIFTLSPIGRNPQCYRLYEAVEAGSIPVVIRDDLHVADAETNPCRRVLKHWQDAPIVILDSWDELYPTMHDLLENLEELDKMQSDLLTWYEDYMTAMVEEFEDYILDSDSSS
mmetsp:Transcript_24544/g.52065  ORF Transcript_24544/g.52065 Transcript_24544/m.52065 type:complete len:437 (+) Transcript_24544:382-1692(+)|eukprot:CAMPEP_0183721214 /NCGR_PEP_ID=MMETSP0737-20130205/13564_1 /TAXON_ID=385413 /ORGANISM="Thalassiosira miniscula, Strain CCMP1093" /LENGTH=436 /DNA_ID=CAMNT_0025951185 /DNA_START=355 /DNA_END=1665 /DNA_ORIENTATION=+